MYNQVFGASTVLLCIFLFYRAYQLSKTERVNMSLVFIVLAGLALRVFVASDLFLHDWDERFHALVAKNMMEAPLRPMLYSDPVLPYNFKSWTENHVWMHKQPFPLWAMAGSLKLFGVNEIALRIPSLLLSTFAIYLTFSIASYLFNKKTGLIAAFLHSINGFIIELTGGRITTDHFDVFFLCLIELAIFLSLCSIKKQKAGFQILTGIVMGFAILSKWLPALIVLPVWLLLAWDSRKFSPKEITFQLSLIIAAASMIVLPWQFHIYSRFPEEAAWESHYNWLHIFIALEGHEGSFLYHFNKMRIHWGELVYLPLGWFIYRLIKRRNLKMLALATWVFVPYIFFSLVQTKMQAYTLFTAPAVFILIAWHCIILLKKPLYFNHRRFSILILLLLLLLPVRYSIERVKPFQNKERNPAWAQELRQMGQREWPEKTVIFNMERPVEAMFYSNFTAYAAKPDETTVQDLANRGYSVFIKNGKGIQERYGNLANIKIIE